MTDIVKITSPVKPLQIVNKINAVVDSVNNKQDTLVSGTNIKTINNESILGKGNITVGGSSASYDGTTINENSNKELQAVGLINQNVDVNATNPLQLWEGTEVEWNQGGGIKSQYYAWKRANLEASSTTLTSGHYIGYIYNNGRHIAINYDNNTAVYSDDGETWTEVSFPRISCTTICYGDGKLITGNGSYICYSTNNGTSWSSTSSTTGTLFAYGNNIFVSFKYDDASDTYYTSTNGTSWTSRTFPNSVTVYDVKYLNNKFIILATNKSYISTDGINWIEGDLPISYDAQGSIAYGNGKFLVVGKNSSGATLISSTDGINWTTISTIGAFECNNIIFNDNKFIITNVTSKIGTLNRGYEIYTSEDGITWDYLKTSEYQLDCTIYSNDILGISNASILMISDISTYYTETAEPTNESVVYSEPGVASELTVTDVDLTWHYLRLSDNKSYGGPVENIEYYTIAEIYPNLLCNIEGIGVKKGDILIANSVSDLSFAGTDGLTNGTKGLVPAPIIADANKFLKSDGTWSDLDEPSMGVINQNTATSATNPLQFWEGTEREWNQGRVKDTYYNWENVTRNWTSSSFSPTVEISDVAYGNGIYVTSNYSSVCYSTDCVNWNQVSLNNFTYSPVVCYGNGKFIACSGYSRYIYYSEDGKNWSSSNQLESSLPYYPKAAAYGNNRFVIIFEDGTIVSSSDGINWTRTIVSSYYGAGGITFGNGKFVAITYNASYSTHAIISEDGINWTTITVPSQNDSWNTIAYGNNMFVTPSYGNNHIMYSYDGLNWNHLTISSDINFNNKKITFSNGKFIVYESPNTITGSQRYLYSIDGIHWTKDSDNLPIYHLKILKGVNNRFFGGSGNYSGYGVRYLLGDINIDRYFTKNIETPTTSTAVYSAPDTVSNLTISSVDTGTITLSNAITYNYNADNNEYSYYNIGNLYPNLLCNVEGIGVKKGNALISNNFSIVEDNSTITKNDNNQLQVEGIINQNTTTTAVNTLKLWEGTEKEWNVGGGIKDTYYGWNYTGLSYPVIYNSSESYCNFRIAVNTNDNSTLVACNYTGTSSTIKSFYSTDKGNTWTEINHSDSFSGYAVCYDGTKFVMVGSGANNKRVAISEDGINWEYIVPTITGGASSFSTNNAAFIYMNGMYVYCDGYRIWHSEDLSSWTGVSANNVYMGKICYGNGIFIIRDISSNSYNYYRSTDGITWENKSITYGKNIAFDGKKFYTFDSSRNVYSSEDGITWTLLGTYPSSMNINHVFDYVNGKFICEYYGKLYIAEIPTSWIEIATISNYNSIYYDLPLDDSNIIFVGQPKYMLTLTIDNCYTLEKEPITSSQVYSAPEIESSLTITSADTGTITLSNTHTYSVTSNAYSYYTVAETYPDLLCNIENVGVKKGNTLIAEKNQVISEEDNSTITKNDNNQLQVEGIINQNNINTTTNPLKFWEGTEAEWNIDGGIKGIYYGWSNLNLAKNNNTFTSYAVAYGNNTIVLVGYGKNTSCAAYSTNNGKTWTTTSMPDNSYTNWKSVAYGNGTFVAVNENYTFPAYSNDGITWTSSANVSNISYARSVAYGNGTFVIVGNNSNALAAYSTDNGQTWSNSNLPKAYKLAVCYGNGTFVTVGQNGNAAYSTDDGQTWNSSTMPSTDSYYAVCYGDGKFVAIGQNGNAAYSTDDGQTWKALSLSSINWQSICYGDGKFVAVAQTNPTRIAISKDGIKWTEFTDSTFTNANYISYINDRYIALNQSSYTADITFDTVYTDLKTPTTESTIYSAPEVASALTITSIGTGAITLSDTKTYTSISGYIENSYYTVAETYPDIICNVENVGIKKGNNLIANNTKFTYDSITETLTIS